MISWDKFILLFMSGESQLRKSVLKVYHLKHRLWNQSRNISLVRVGPHCSEEWTKQNHYCLGPCKSCKNAGSRVQNFEYKNGYSSEIPQSSWTIRSKPSKLFDLPCFLKVINYMKALEVDPAGFEYVDGEDEMPSIGKSLICCGECVGWFKSWFPFCGCFCCCCGNPYIQVPQGCKGIMTR